MICTHGEVIITIRDIPINFQVVSNDFPIKQMGILGISFLEKQEVTLTFRDKLPNSLQFGKGKSSPCIFSSFDLAPRTKTLISVPSVELEEFNIKPPAPRSYRPGDSNLNHSSAHAQRFVQLVKALNLESLNEAERVSIPTQG